MPKMYCLVLPGFEKLIQFLQSTRELKAKALALGEDRADV